MYNVYIIIIFNYIIYNGIYNYILYTYIYIYINFIYKIIKKIIERFKNDILCFNFVINYIIHKMLILLRNHLNFLDHSIFRCLYKEYMLNF